MKTKMTFFVLPLLLMNALSMVLVVNPVSATITNKVWFEISHGYWIGTEEDVVVNVPYPRTHQWFFQAHNWIDETGQHMINPTFVVSTEREFVDFSPWAPSISDGQYEWDFALELPECYLLPAAARESDYVDYARPRFSAERLVSPETLADPTTIQDLTFAFTLEEPLPADVNSIQIGIGLGGVIFEEERLVSYSVLWMNNVQDWVTGDNSWNADPANIPIGKTYIFEATLEATKSSDLGGTPTVKPGILVHYAHWTEHISGGIGSSATAIHPEGLSMTVSAEGEYEWFTTTSYSRQDFWIHQVVSEVIENPLPPPPYVVRIPATVDIEPDTFNLKRRAEWITSYIELPEGYDVGNINVSTLLLGGVFPASPKPTEIGDYDNDAVPDLMVKFDISALDSEIGIVSQDSQYLVSIEVPVTGELYDGTLFQGSDTIRIILQMP